MQVFPEMGESFFDMLNRLGRHNTPFLAVVDFEMQAPLCFSLPANPSLVRYDFRGKGNQPGGIAVPAPAITRFPVDFSCYHAAFKAVMAHLEHGDSFLTNLTFPTPVATEAALGDFFHETRAPYRLWLPKGFACFSPECFVRIESDRIYSFPMKGTIDATLPGARERILSDEKEKAEHFTIVDLIRNDLNRVADGVRVDEFRYTETILTSHTPLIQVSSRISGDLGAGWQGRIGRILESLLPAGSVSGAPKEKTLEVIRQVEGAPRGYYTGVAGLFDGNSFDSAVLIRFVRQEGDHLVFHSGGGITIQSDARSEYQELIDKVYVPAI